MGTRLSSRWTLAAPCRQGPDWRRQQGHQQKQGQGDNQDRLRRCLSGQDRALVNVDIAVEHVTDQVTQVECAMNRRRETGMVHV